ncbi:MAG: phosphoserine phosphatase SerB [Candidatus Puniceispirillales bacterium]
MFTATLITAPDAATLGDDAVAGLCSRWEGEGITWLAAAEAASFRLPALPDDADAVRADLHKAGIDLVISPGIPQPKALLVADMDSTMIEQECLDELAAMAGVGDRVKAITVRAMNDEIGFEEALDERVALLRGHPASLIDAVIANRITLMPGGPALIATMKGHGAYTVLVSGGFLPFTGHVAAMLGFDAHYGNDLLIEDGRFTGAVGKPVLGRDTKLETLRATAASRGLDLADTMAVGDGANDLAMLKAAGMGVALHAKPVVAAASDIQINHGDLTALLYLQGYSKAEFSLPAS